MNFKSIIFNTVLAFLLLSCEKKADFLIPESEIPNWLKTKIVSDESTLKSNPESSISISAWIRYEYGGDYYYEFINLLSSAGPMVFKSDSTEFNYREVNFFDYQSGKCCKRYVWKGPSYFGN